jgi:hypothetical protein
MSSEVLDRINSSTSFMYDVDENIIKNQKNDAMWIFELEELCDFLSAKNFSYSIDYGLNITDIRKRTWPKI